MRLIDREILPRGAIPYPSVPQWAEKPDVVFFLSPTKLLESHPKCHRFQAKSWNPMAKTDAAVDIAAAHNPTL